MTLSTVFFPNNQIGLIKTISGMSHWPFFCNSHFPHPHLTLELVRLCLVERRELPLRLLAVLRQQCVVLRDALAGRLLDGVVVGDVDQFLNRLHGNKGSGFD